MILTVNMLNVCIYVAQKSNIHFVYDNENSSSSGYVEPVSLDFLRILLINMCVYCFY